MMRYDTLPFSSALIFLLRHRIPILIFILSLVAASTFLIKQEISNQDYQLWINGSKANTDLRAKEYTSSCINKIVVDISDRSWNPKTEYLNRRFYQLRM